ncbi:hypothetical protein AB4Y45_33625 [Paraburkholderia sp. EG287A]|uniref:hypothetical protein n=1 Tax=Paraburkholderia sp. EG287A TaxID=3237012 RepID=UPI0034D306E0
MKSSKIFVGANGETILLAKGRAVAFYPPQKGGEPASYALMESGELARIPGTRWHGLVISRYLKEQGFELVNPHVNPGADYAERLADLLDRQEGRNLVAEAASEKATELQRAFAGQSCTFVPFEETKAAAAVTIKDREGTRTYCIDLTGNFSAGSMRIEYVTGSNLGLDVKLSDGWLVGPNGDVSAMPRNTEYGGLVEKAVYVICNSGLGSLVGDRNLRYCAKSVYTRGTMKFALENGDIVQVGVDGGDDLHVTYFRDGKVQYTRNRMDGPSLGEIVGSIAAVIVRVREQDAAKMKKVTKKAA